MILVQNKNYNRKQLTEKTYNKTIFKDVFIKFTSIDNIVFSDCNFVNVDFGTSDITDCKFYDCNFSNCDLFSTNFKKNEFKNINASDFDLRHGMLTENRFENCFFLTHVLEDLNSTIIYLIDF